MELRARILMRDPSLPHQIVIGRAGNLLYVSCNCQAIRGSHGGVYGHEPIGARTRWDAEDALAVYRAHLPDGA